MRTEKRINHRHSLQIPLRFRRLDRNCKESPVSTHTVDISSSGLCMTSPRHLELGSWLLMTLRVPTELSGSAFGEIECTGRVVRKQTCEDGTDLYGIKLEQMMPSPSHRLSMSVTDSD
jgi:hypothetical protein